MSAPGRRPPAGTPDDTDRALRAALDAAHAEDAPPPFSATLARPRARVGRRRPALGALGLAGAVAAVAVAVWVVRPGARSGGPGAPAAPVSLAGLEGGLRTPLDFLLEPPAGSWLATTPRLDEGGLP